MRLVAAAYVGLLVMSVGTGCADKRAVMKSKDLAGGSAILTSAEVRAITHLKPAVSVGGRVVPSHITCSEPSPDVAKAVSEAFNMGGALSVRGLPANIEPKVAFAVSRANAQALAQLTERLATIQLLRDGLHRACEAYANGALTDTAYAVMLSRFDKIMATMLLGEFAAGGFGRSLAALGAGAEGEASGELQSQQKDDRNRELETQVKTLEDQREAAVTSGGDPAAAAKQVERASKQIERAQREMIDNLKTQAKSGAQVTQVTAAGGITPSHSVEIARVLGDMQRKYVENINFDALEVACVTALDRGDLSADAIKESQAVGSDFSGRATAASSAGPAGAAAMQDALAGAQRISTTFKETRLTALGVYCMSSILPTIQQAKMQLLRDILGRAASEKSSAVQRERLDRTLTDAKELIKALKDFAKEAKD